MHLHATTPYSYFPKACKASLHFRPLCSQTIYGVCTSIKGCSRSRVLRVSCKSQTIDLVQLSGTKNLGLDGVASEFTCVMKFGGSSVASAQRMREIADLILSFPEEKPVIVLSAMGKTTNNLLLVNAFDIFMAIHF